MSVEFAKFSINSLPILIINLEKDVDRRSETLKKLQAIDIIPEIITGYDCLDNKFNFNDYSFFKSDFWGNKIKFKPGAFGCYLSHAKAWREFLRKGQPYALILEDDIVPNNSIINNIISVPKTFDVLLVNYMPFKWACQLRAQCKSYKSEKDLISLPDLFLDMVINNKFNGKIPAPGAYSYIISRKGAFKLLKILEYQKIAMGVDYAILFNSLSSSNLNKIAPQRDNIGLERLFIYIDKIKKYYNLSSYAFINDYYFSVDPAFKSVINHAYYLDQNCFDIL